MWAAEATVLAAQVLAACLAAQAGEQGGAQESLAGRVLRAMDALDQYGSYEVRSRAWTIEHAAPGNKQVLALLSELESSFRRLAVEEAERRFAVILEMLDESPPVDARSVTRGLRVVTAPGVAMQVWIEPPATGGRQFITSLAELRTPECFVSYKEMKPLAHLMILPPRPISILTSGSLISPIPSPATSRAMLSDWSWEDASDSTAGPTKFLIKGPASGSHYVGSLSARGLVDAFAWIQAGNSGAACSTYAYAPVTSGSGQLWLRRVCRMWRSAKVTMVDDFELSKVCLEAVDPGGRLQIARETLVFDKRGPGTTTFRADQIAARVPEVAKYISVQEPPK